MVNKPLVMCVLDLLSGKEIFIVCKRYNFHKTI
jgi:hypothetical protein